jgi:hypothetical protein
MEDKMNTWLDILYVLLGAILSIVITAVIELNKKPSLTMEIQNNDITRYDDNSHPAKTAKFLYVVVENKDLPKLFKWLSRSAAMQCHGTVTFHHLNDGTRVFQSPMPIRWTSLPTPEGEKYIVENQIIQMFDMNKINHYSRVDIYTGESNKESLNIAARFDDEEDCYGWTNENFVSTPLWRTLRWKLPKGRYLVRVSVLSAGEKCEKLFRLINDVSMNDFRLEPALKNDNVND